MSLASTYSDAILDPIYNFKLPFHSVEYLSFLQDQRVLSLSAVFSFPFLLFGDTWCKKSMDS